MDFKEFLVKQGVAEEQADAVVKGMPENKFYLTTAEHLDERYTKLKEQNEQSNTDLKSANELIDKLQKDNQSIKGLQTQVEDYKTQIEQAQTDRLAEQKSNAVNLALRDANARNPKTVLALLDMDTVKLQRWQA